jgi:uncharacterized protein with PIN domain
MSCSGLTRSSPSIQWTRGSSPRVTKKWVASYGRRNHEAALNLGDCFAYALAKATGEPLLFKGADFAKTGIPSAL